MAGLPARTRGAVASIIFRLPVMSQFFTWMGNLPADRGSMLAALARGESLGVMPEVRPAARTVPCFCRWPVWPAGSHRAVRQEFSDLHDLHDQTELCGGSGLDAIT